jgi:hypothetical protein
VAGAGLYCPGKHKFTQLLEDPLLEDSTEGSQLPLIDSSSDLLLTQLPLANTGNEINDGDSDDDDDDDDDDDHDHDDHDDEENDSL